MKKKSKIGKILKPVGNILKSVALGASGGTLKPIVGALVGLKEGIASEFVDNVNSENGGQGKVDWVRIVSMVGVLVLIGLVVAGKIDLDTFNALVEAIKE